MLDHLIAPPTVSATIRRIAAMSGASLVMHTAVLTAAVYAAVATGTEAALDAPSQQVQFVSLPAADDRPPPAAPPIAQDAGAPLRAAPKYLPSQGKGPIAGEAPAGFQELQAPPEIKGIPPVDLAQQAVDTADFSGRGVIGGSGHGKPPDGPIATLASDVMRAGDSLASNLRLTPVAPAPDPASYVYDVSSVTEPPVLLDSASVLRVLLALYPPTLRQAGVGGRVIAECVVGINGRVEPQSIRIAETTEELFGSATAVALPQLRFKPAQLAYRGKLVAVRMQVRIPVNWEIRY